jgi:prephenate dehydratase
MIKLPYNLLTNNEMIYGLGPQNTFTEQAINEIQEKYEIQDYPVILLNSNPDVIAKVSGYNRLQNPRSNLSHILGVVPDRNSKGGIVQAAYHAMHDCAIIIRGQHKMAIEQIGGTHIDSYLCEPKENKTLVTSIATHIQAWRQSQKEILAINKKRKEISLEELKLIETPSTAVGAEMAKNNPTIMAIGPKIAIQNNGLIPYNNGVSISPIGNNTAFNLIQPGNIIPEYIINDMENQRMSLDELGGLDTLMINAKIPNITYGQGSLKEVIGKENKMGIRGQDWKWSGLETEQGSEVMEIDLGNGNPDDTYKLIKNLREWKETGGTVQILGIYKRASL